MPLVIGPGRSPYNNRLGSVLNYKPIIPTDLPNLEEWLTADSVVDASGKASQITDLSGKARHQLQATAGNQAAIVANSLNGHNKLVFDRTTATKYKTATIITLPQPMTVYLFMKPAINGAASRGFWGTGSYAFYYSDPMKLSAYAGTIRPFENTNVFDLSVWAIVFRDDSTEWYRDGILYSTTGSIGVGGISDYLNLGNFDGSNATCSSMDFYEKVMYSSAHDGYDIFRILDYFRTQYTINPGINLSTPPNKNRFDGIFKNSINIQNNETFVQRNPFSEFEFYTTDDCILISAHSTIRPDNRAASYVTIFEDDVYKQKIIVNSDDSRIVKLSAGNKKVTICDGITQSLTTEEIDSHGTYLTSVKATSFTKVNEAAHTEKIVFVGHSILCGANATIPEVGGWSRLFKTESGKNVAILGYANSRLNSIAGDATDVNRTVGYITSLFSLTTTRKICAIQIGYNDMPVLTAVNFGIRYAALLDAIHTADATIEIYCFADTDQPLTQLLIDYSEQINTVCSTRNWTTYRSLADVGLLAADYNGTPHLSDAGHKKVKDFAYALIYP